ncbi:RBR-type E3 ubiquitin transferase [Aphelenchoides besseyi]|nr:RBR-type E3 ubiquitin transferase [Aphelenchoides besseyi]
MEEDDFYSDNDNASVDSIEGMAMERDQELSMEERDYEILNQDQLLTELSSIANETSAVMGFTPAICKILLHHFHWNKEHLIEKFYEIGDNDRFLHDYNVIVPSVDASSSQNAESSTCQICFEEPTLAKLSCGHAFGAQCWHQYLSVKINDEAQWLVPCPGEKCVMILDEDLIFKLVQEASVLKAFKKLIVNSFVSSSARLKWCPGTDCGLVAKVPHPECRAITCKCRTIFCFFCGHQWHEPINCDMLKMWLKKCSDDSETSNWLHANTKDCPQCHVTIEKDGGCNHVSCKTCKFEFCWTCLGPWKPHGSGWYSCNRFDDTDAKKARDEQERSRAALQRYLHFFTRYENHQKSLKLEHKLFAQVQDKMRQMQQQEYSWIETQYLRKAVDVLNQCRQTLMYTYAFAFYLQPNNTTSIFEDNQRDLELATEHLSELLEKDLEIEREKLTTWKQTVQDKYRYVQQRRSVLLNHVAEGTNRNEWKFNYHP